MHTFIYIVIAGTIIAFCYYKRHGFRRAWYVLRTGAEDPDWDKLGADYFISPRERDRMNRSRQKMEDQAQSVSESR